MYMKGMFDETDGKEIVKIKIIKYKKEKRKKKN
jgi:hypothetical protein